MNEADRIRLVEAMGWKSKQFGSEWCYETPDGHIRAVFDPFTDANDCEALIRHLVSLGYRLCIEWVPDRRLVVEVYICTFSKKPVDDLMYWKGDDYKQGVCELALKVLDK